MVVRAGLSSLGALGGGPLLYKDISETMCTTFIFQTITTNKHQPIENRKVLKQVKQSVRLSVTINLKHNRNHNQLVISIVIPTICSYSALFYKFVLGFNLIIANQRLNLFGLCVIYDNVYNVPDTSLGTIQTIHKECSSVQWP